MTDLSPVATGPAEPRSSTSTAPASKPAAGTKPTVKKAPPEPKPAEAAPSDRLRLSFTSQAKLLRQQGLSPAEIAANLGVTQQQVEGALQSAETVTAALTSVLDERS